ncbi:DUF2480 family protein [Chitinophagaceae bacterium LB-8]|uniref:DUF2480 family protein n=1 Tax=Paraflavisolibacter caeni TaxID=2982496 RepID=A0A9X2XXA0_9BACT|nr:DUF2480 family protein [Paraflavisolibacter caeni]MCU7550991.1 DUF2480 family protein [Paraflavisolibacter caeni]
MIENKVASSGLITLNLEDYLPNRDIVTFDLKDFLFMELILKEKDYRETLKNKDWEEYRDQYVAVTCSADAIIPVWAYMLAVSYLQPVARDVYMGTMEEMQKHILLKNIDAIQTEDFEDQRVVVKGCGDKPIDNAAFAEITRILLPVVKSIMYGEPCSTVPIYKKK